MKEMTSQEDLAGFGIAGAVILVAGAGGLRRRIVPPIALCLYFCFGAYVLALLLSTWVGVEQIHPTWHRFGMQLSLPLGVLLALALRAGWRARRAFNRPPVSREGTAARIGIRGPLVFLAFAVSPVLLVLLVAAETRDREKHALAGAVARGVAPASVTPTWREDASLAGSVDEPAERSSVRGRLAVRGWARLPDRDLEVTVVIDGKERLPLTRRRLGRPDVQNALPALGDCASAGYEITYPFSAEDAGPHELQVIFRSADGRERHYPARRFTWLEEPSSR